MKRLETKQRISDWLIEDRGPEVARHLRILTPVISIIFLAVLFVSVSLFYLESRNQTQTVIEQRLENAQQLAREFYDQEIEEVTDVLSGFIAILKRDQLLADRFASRDRNALLDYVQPLYRDFNAHHDITHFYFTGPDRINLLRVHTPQRYGDRIDRLTTIKAEQYGKLSAGIELGVLGTLTLRVVAPWHDTQSGRLIGYVELGMELDDVIRRVGEPFGHESLLLIHKELLDRQLWEKGMKELGRPANWDQFEETVLAADLTPNIPLSVLQDSEQLFYQHPHKPVPLKQFGYRNWIMALSLHDVADQEVAELILLVDVSEETQAVNTTLVVVGAMVLVLGLTLVFIFSWQMIRASRQIQMDEELLKHLAVHDSLTRLYTRRVFHQYLDAEIERSLRFNHPLSLLMVDIDYFKKVNDEYGHQVGDKVLQEVSLRLTKSVRSVDHICRYGGEELTIILPETDTDTARHFAERINDVIAALPIDAGGDLLIPVTVSIGIATYPEHADSDTLLISASDKALYAAKKAGRNRICVYSAECE